VEFLYFNFSPLPKALSSSPPPRQSNIICIPLTLITLSENSNVPAIKSEKRISIVRGRAKFIVFLEAKKYGKQKSQINYLTSPFS
jgi:hypothetical protein